MDFNYLALVTGEGKVDAAMNAIRTASFALTPAEISMRAQRDQIWKDFAIFKATGKLDPDVPQIVDEATKEVVLREVSRLYALFQEQSLEEIGKLRRELGVEYINRLLQASHGMHQSMVAIMSSVVIESWMAFETLAADLFFKALDHGPPEWRIRTAQRHKEFSGGSNWEPPKISPAVMHDPQENYGSSLRDQDVISFRKFRLIKFWYKAAFGNKAESLFQRVDDGYIRALAAVRNVLTHKAGISRCNIY